MFGWLRRWAQRLIDRKIERLVAENQRWKAQWREEFGDEPFPLTPEERERLRQRRDAMSPQSLKEIGWSAEDDRFFGLDEPPPGARRSPDT